MRYIPDQFLALMEVVEAQGGVHLVDPCKPGEYFLDREDYRGNLKKRKFYTAGCNRAARFLVPYTSDIDEAEHTLVACAVDDGMGAWPRFGGEPMDGWVPDLTPLQPKEPELV